MKSIQTIILFLLFIGVLFAQDEIVLPDTTVADSVVIPLAEEETEMLNVLSDTLMTEIVIPEDSTLVTIPDSAAVSIPNTLAALVETPIDSVLEEPAVFEPIPEELMGLDYGYKGFPWGTPKGQLPQFQYMNSSSFSEDSSAVILNATLGEDDVTMTYAFSDSGFWKVEIEYQLNPEEIEFHIAEFLRIEKGIYEIYGPPQFTHKVEAGPTSAYSNVLDIKYSRAFYTSTWNVTPCKILLLLNSIVQVPQTDLPILDGDISIFRLVYYNPDFMISTDDMNQDNEPLPSLFDLY